MANVVKDSDRLHVIISGVNSSTGQGRTTRAVDLDANLKAFMSEYGDGVPEDQKDQDWNELKGLSGDELKKALATLAASVEKSGTKPLVEQIVDAICVYLQDEKDFVIAETDPGTDKFYIARSNLMPTAVEVPNDGTIWTVIAAAPFGHAA